MDWSGVDYLWVIVMFLSAVWTLILTAPIHCRWSVGEQVMECYISPKIMKKQTHLHLGWPEGKDIFISGWTIPLGPKAEPTHAKQTESFFLLVLYEGRYSLSPTGNQICLISSPPPHPFPPAVFVSLITSESITGSNGSVRYSCRRRTQALDLIRNSIS